MKVESPLFDVEQELAIQSLQELVDGQVDEFVRLNLHEQLGLTPTEYKNGFRLPATYTTAQHEQRMQDMRALGLELPVVADPRVNLKTFVEKLKISDPVPQRKYVDLNASPQKPYLIWTHGRDKWEKRSVSAASEEFDTGIVGSSLKEIISIYISYPELFADGALEAASTRGFLEGDRLDREFEAAPYLSKFGYDLRLAVGLINNHVKGWQVSARSRTPVVLSSQ